MKQTLDSHANPCKPNKHNARAALCELRLSDVLAEVGDICPMEMAEAARKAKLRLMSDLEKMKWATQEVE